MIIVSLSSDVFERRTSTGSGLFALLSRDFDQLFGQIVSIRIKTLDNRIWNRQGLLKEKKAYFRLTCVDQKRRCLSSLIAFSRLSDSRDEAQVLGTQKRGRWRRENRREFPLVLFSCSRFLNFANVTISEPGKG